MPQTYTFQALLLEQMNDLYAAEELCSEFLPKIIDVTSSGELRETFDDYLKNVSEHITYLNASLQEMKLRLTNAKCPPIAGIVEEAQTVIEHGGNSSTKDAALIAIVQRIQHYKMAVYGTARTFARHLNFNDSMELLQRALNEEGEKDRQLTRIAEGGLFSTGINEEACRG